MVQVQSREKKSQSYNSIAVLFSSLTITMCCVFKVIELLMMLPCDFFEIYPVFGHLSSPPHRLNAGRVHTLSTFFFQLAFWCRFTGIFWCTLQVG
mgnify:CR=1 FL=1